MVCGDFSDRKLRTSFFNVLSEQDNQISQKFQLAKKRLEISLCKTFIYFASLCSPDWPQTHSDPPASAIHSTLGFLCIWGGEGAGGRN